jgi:hypothetical protein
LTETVGESIIKATINGLSSGVSYKFRYRSNNIHGWSLDFSPEIEVKTLIEPMTITGVETQVIGDVVRISWIEPYSGGVNIEITSYSIKVLTKAGTYISDAECDGTDPAVISNQYCEISMSILTSTFGLELGDLIVVKVNAINEKGAGEDSEPNTVGALAESLPLAPTSAPTRGELTNESQVDVDWEFLTTYTQRGGATIDSYELQIDDGANGAFAEAIGFTSPYTLNSLLVSSGISSGLTYRFRYRVHNVHGWGDFSPIGSILAAVIPEATGAPETTIEDTNLKISWSAPLNSGGVLVEISSYRV